MNVNTINKNARENDAEHAELLMRMKEPNYSEPAIGWNTDDEKSGVVSFGVANYESTKELKVKAPPRPMLMPPPVPVELEAEPTLFLM